jgi:hypothetical protein
MKKLFLVFSFLFQVLSHINGQVFDLNTKWYYCRGEWPTLPGKCYIREIKNINIQNDTIFSDLLWEYYNTKLKQKGNKVWINDELIYNFDLKKSDTFKIKFNDKHINFFLDSVQIREYFGKERKLQYFSEISGWTKIICIEGIGVIKNYNTLGYNFQYGEIFLTLSELRLFEFTDPPPRLSIVEIGKNRTNINLLGECKFCEDLVFQSSISQEKVEIFPNPGNSTIFIEGLPNNSIFKIFDISGKLWKNIKQISGDMYLDISMLKNGFYQVIIETENSKPQIKRFIKY